MVDVGVLGIEFLYVFDGGDGCVLVVEVGCLEVVNYVFVGCVDCYFLFGGYDYFVVVGYCVVVLYW